MMGSMTRPSGPVYATTPFVLIAKACDFTNAKYSYA